MRSAALLLIVAAIAVTTAYADVPVPGKEEFKINYRITNIGDFPDWLFITSSTIFGWEYAQVINDTGTFGGGYKLDEFLLHGIREMYIDLARFKANPKSYAKEDNRFVLANLSLPVSRLVDERAALAGIEVLLEVDGINDQRFDVSMTEVIYRYKDGTTEELIISGNDIPSPTRR
jgi:hypothetical protein